MTCEHGTRNPLHQAFSDMPTNCEASQNPSANCPKHSETIKGKGFACPSLGGSCDSAFQLQFGTSNMRIMRDGTVDIVTCHRHGANIDFTDMQTAEPT